MEIIQPHKIRSFTDLFAWQQGHKLVLQVYKATDTFPAREKSILTSQLLRAAISVTSNIAEGFSTITNKSKRSYYHIALASLTEAQNQLLIARDLGYLNQDEFEMIAAQVITVNKLIHGLIKNVGKLENRHILNP